MTKLYEEHADLYLAAQVIRADIADFQLGRLFDGTVCPINTLAHLSREGLARHLVRIAVWHELRQEPEIGQSGRGKARSESRR